MKHLVLIAIFISIELALAALWVSAQSGITTFQVSQDFVNSVNSKLTSLQTQITAIPAQMFPTTASNGGTGVTNPTVHSVPIAEGVSAFNLITLATDQMLVGVTGADPIAVNNPNCAIDGAHASVFNSHTWNCVSVAGSGGLQPANNLSDVSNTSTSWVNLATGAEKNLCTITGSTAGTAQCYQQIIAHVKYTTCYFTGYQNTTGTQQTCSLTANGGSACTQSANVASQTEPYATVPQGSPPTSLNLPYNMLNNPASLTQVFQMGCV